MWTWYASRAAGLVAFATLSAVLLLGIAAVSGAATERWPRFAVARLHRDLSLTAVAFVLIHVLTAVLDGYVDIRWVDLLVPFASGWQPFWLGLGTVALDLLAAVTLTSLVRGRLPLRLWRVVHLGAYGCWALGLAHGLGISGSDVTAGWVLVAAAACIAAVGGAIAWRITLVDRVDRRVAR